MGADEFVVPSDEDILDALGVVTEDGDEETTRVIRVSTGVGEEVIVSYDVVGRSVRFQWFRDAERVADIFREGATRLGVESGGGAAHITADFDTDSLGGKLSIQVLPWVRITDRLLYR